MITNDKSPVLNPNLMKNYIIDKYELKVINVAPLVFNSINKLYVVKTKNKKYLLKIVNAIDSERFIQSVRLQDYVSKHNLSPKCIVNNSGELYSLLGSNYLMLQEYIEHSYNEVSQEDLCSSIIMLHDCLNVSEIIHKGGKINIPFIEILDKLNKYEFRIQNTYLAKNENVKILYNLRLSILNKFKINYTPSVYGNIHGDLRPENIIISKNRILFIDFDYSKYGDLHLELMRVFILLSRYKNDVLLDYIKMYNHLGENKLALEKTIINYLAYLVQSNYPIRLVDEISEETYNKITLERINTINYLCSLLAAS